MKAIGTIQEVLEAKDRVRVISVTPRRTVYEALKLMAEQDIGALMVLDEGKLLGIFSERDYARKGVLHGHASRETLVSQIMSSPVFSVTPTHTIDECMTLMTERHFRHLPVINEKTVVGLVSIGDLVKWIIDGHEQRIMELEGYISGAYPA
jgi:CBS domain-containing protein